MSEVDNSGPPEERVKPSRLLATRGNQVDPKHLLGTSMSKIGARPEAKCRTSALHVLALLALVTGGALGAYGAEVPTREPLRPAYGVTTYADAGQTSPLELDLETPISDGAESASKSDYNSRPLGQAKRWELDTGYFDFDDRESGLLRPGEPENNYSGIRIRRPRGN